MDISAVSPALRAFAKSRNPAPPAHFGTRYDMTGRFLPEPGNTVVCHLLPDSATELAVVRARARYLAMPEAGQLAFTPVSSLHMTLFQGIIEGRRTPGFWPADLPLDTPVPEMTAQMHARLDGLAPQPPFRVAVIGARPQGLVVAGATPADRRAMAAWRDALATLWGYRHPDHDAYVFHITFDYLIDWLPDEALPAWQTMLDAAASSIAAAAPVLELRPPAFCSFADMNHFEELRVPG